MKTDRGFIVKTVICLLFAVVAGVSLMFRHSRKENMNLSMKGLLKEFSSEAPAEICISWKTNVTTLVLTDGVWRVKERGGHAADTAKVSRLIEELQKIRPLRCAVPADEATCSLLRVRPEEKEQGKIPGVRIRITDKNQNTLRDIVLGAGYFNETEIVMPGKEPEPAGRWMGILQKDGSVVPVLISRMLEEFTPVPGSWMSSPVFDKINQLVRIEYESGKKTAWMIGRFSVKAPFESIIPGKASVSQQKLNVLANILSQRYTFEGTREKDAGKLNYIGKLETLDSTGFVRTLSFYRADKVKGGVLCKVSAAERKNKTDRTRVDSFTKGRDGWLYVIPEKVFEKIKTNPAGD